MKRLTTPAYPNEHSNANKIDQVQRRVDGKHGIPEYEALIKWELAPKQKADPTTETCVSRGGRKF